MSVLGSSQISPLSTRSQATAPAPLLRPGPVPEASTRPTARPASRGPQRLVPRCRRRTYVPKPMYMAMATRAERRVGPVKRQSAPKPRTGTHLPINPHINQTNSTSASPACFSQLRTHALGAPPHNTQRPNSQSCAMPFSQLRTHASAATSSGISVVSSSGRLLFGFSQPQNHACLLTSSRDKGARA